MTHESLRSRGTAQEESASRVEESETERIGIA